MCTCLFTKVGGELENNFFDQILQGCARYWRVSRGQDIAARGETQFAIKLRSENSTMIGTGRVVAAIERENAAGLPGKHFAEGRQKFRLAILAEPLDFVFVAMGAKSGELR